MSSPIYKGREDLLVILLFVPIFPITGPIINLYWVLFCSSSFYSELWI